MTGTKDGGIKYRGTYKRGSFKEKIFSIRNFSFKIVYIVIQKLNNTSFTYTSFISSLYFLANFTTFYKQAKC